MHEMRASYGVSGKAECPPSARVREVRIKGNGESLLDVRSKIWRVNLIGLELPDGNLPALMI